MHLPHILIKIPKGFFIVVIKATNRITKIITVCIYLYLRPYFLKFLLKLIKGFILCAYQGYILGRLRKRRVFNSSQTKLKSHTKNRIYRIFNIIKMKIFSNIIKNYILTKVYKSGANLIWFDFIKVTCIF